jgi:hypothetical protein
MKKYLAAGLTLWASSAVATALLWQTRAPLADAHCQVPCGIYDDPARIAQLREDATTIGKAVDQIRQLGGKHEVLAINQATRWIMTKEDHASHIIEVVSLYFLTQKLKPVPHGDEGHDPYLHALADHHAVMVAAMKTKQTVDPAAVAELNHAIDALARHYMK